MQLEVDFEPQTVGSHNGKLIVTYDTGMLRSVFLLTSVLHSNVGQVEK